MVAVNLLRFYAGRRARNSIEEPAPEAYDAINKVPTGQGDDKKRAREGNQVPAKPHLKPAHCFC